MTRDINVGQQRYGINNSMALPAPTGGWNTRDAESQMPPEDAIIMDNAIPSVGKVLSRWGFTSSATGASSNVESLFSYESGSNSALISASGSVIYSGASGNLTSIGTGFTNARWDGANFNGNLLLVNGADTPQYYNGSTLSAMSITGSGLTPSDFDGVCIFKSFVFYWDSDTQDFWYGDVEAFQGTFVKFQLSRVGQFGGNLVKIETWNVDGGDGVDDLAVFFMSSGDVIVYKGTDPADANAWSLVGVYRIGAPIHKRAVIKLGGDIAIVTHGDFVLFSDVFRKGGVSNTRSKLSGAIASAALNYNSNYGWQIVNYPRGNLLIINVPLNTNTQYHQYVINTITGAAARFTGINARCWTVHQNVLYFGGNTVIYKADSGYKDGSVAINFDVQQAYSTLGVPSVKSIQTIDPVHRADGNVDVNVSLSYDFDRVILDLAISSESTGTPWDTSLWDVSYWSPEAKTRSQAYIARGDGTYVSTRFKSQFLGQQLSWFSTYYNFSNNTIL